MSQRLASRLQVLRKALMRYPKRETSAANTAAVEREIEAVQAEAVATATLIDVRSGLVLFSSSHPLPGSKVIHITATRIRATALACPSQQHRVPSALSQRISSCHHTDTWCLICGCSGGGRRYRSCWGTWTA